MTFKHCTVCGKDAWHNPTRKGNEVGWRCTYCGAPLGTGPKADKLRSVHEMQVNKARRSA